MYTVEIYNHGKYHNIKTGTRFFLTKKSAIKFSNTLDEVDCLNEIFKVQRLSGDCFSGNIPYFKEIKMLNYEEFSELSNFKLKVLKLFKKYDREIMINFLNEE